jgi:acetate kinase
LRRLSSIQAAGSRVKVLVIPTNEELEIAREVLQIINGKKRP